MPNHAPVQHAKQLVLLGMLVVAGACSAAVAAAADPPPGSRPDSTAGQRVGSVKDSPGYYPPTDPEAASERIGRRMNAPKVNKPFVGGARSLKGLARTVTRLIQNSRRDSLENLCVRREEFRDILWREFPQSRPATGAHWSDAWFFQLTRNHKGCGLAMADWGGHKYRYLGMTCDSTFRYRNFTMYSRLKILVRPDSAAGEGADTLKWDWIKAVVARRGRFKILSLRD